MGAGAALTFLSVSAHNHAVGRNGDMTTANTLLGLGVLSFGLVIPLSV